MDTNKRLCYLADNPRVYLEVGSKNLGAMVMNTTMADSKEKYASLALFKVEADEELYPNFSTSEFCHALILFKNKSRIDYF
jgi:hypothetical protein